MFPMRLLPITTAALLGASCAVANAQATNFSRSPGDAPALSGASDVPPYRAYYPRRAVVYQPAYGGAYAYSGPRPYYARYGAPYGYWGNGWNAYGAGVQIGPVGFGVGGRPGYYGDSYAYAGPRRVYPRSYYYWD
jgi:hypothetical protein